MGKRHPNPRLVKIHRSYTVEETAALFHLHKNTVRNWLKLGLPTIDDRRPTLIRGAEIFKFLHARRTASKRPCLPGQIFCLRCRAARNPAGDMADFKAVTETTGNLIGICPTCDSMMYRRINVAKLKQVSGTLDVRLPQAHSRIGESNKPSVNCDLKQGASDHAYAQP